MNYTLKVAQIKRETEDTITLCFKQPGLKKIKYQAGQYLTLIFRINGRRYIRPYSFSSCPGIDTFLEVTVKRVLNGVVSNHIHDIVNEGDSIEVMPPMGDFIFTGNGNISTVFLWGVGSGITPLISIAKYVLNEDVNCNVHLVYGNRNADSTIFLNQIEELQAANSSRFQVTHFHTRLVINKRNPQLVEGRINDEKALTIISQIQGLSSSVHYICGPSGLKESVNKALGIKGIDPKNIFSEDFELVKDPKDYENIHTRNIKLRFNGTDYNLEVIKGKTILEAALDSNIELPYSCQTGNCSTCKGNLIHGEVKSIGLTKERDDLLDNEYLLCCTHPFTDSVFIEI